VIGTDCIGSYKSNYYMIMMAPWIYLANWFENRKLVNVFGQNGLKA